MSDSELVTFATLTYGSGVNYVTRSESLTVLSHVAYGTFRFRWKLIKNKRLRSTNKVYFTIDVNIKSFTPSIESFTPSSKYLLPLSKLLSLRQNSVFLTRKTLLKSCTSISTKTKNNF